MEDPKQDRLVKESEDKKGLTTEEIITPEDNAWDDHRFTTSLNEELSEKIKDNPNKFIGCGG